MQNTVTYSIGNKIPVYVGNYVRKFATLDFKTHLAAFLNHVNQTNWMSHIPSWSLTLLDINDMSY